MAKISEAYAFVDEVKGNRLRLSEKHSSKNPSTQEWTVTGYTDVNTAWMPRDYTGPEIEKGMRVKVSADQKTEKREVGDKVYKNLIWYLNSIEIVQGQVQSGAHSRAQQAQGSPVPPVDEEMPF